MLVGGRAPALGLPVLEYPVPRRGRGRAGAEEQDGRREDERRRVRHLRCRGSSPELTKLIRLWSTWSTSPAPLSSVYVCGLRRPDINYGHSLFSLLLSIMITSHARVRHSAPRPAFEDNGRLRGQKRRRVWRSVALRPRRRGLFWGLSQISYSFSTKFLREADEEAGIGFEIHSNEFNHFKGITNGRIS